MARRGTRKGLSHSRACCLRYEAWLRSQVSSEEAMEVEVEGPVAPEVVHGPEQSLQNLVAHLSKQVNRLHQVISAANRTFTLCYFGS